MSPHFLVTVKNEPQNHLKKPWQEVADRAQKIVGNSSLCPYITHKLTDPCDLNKGICQGMVYVFIRDFYQNRIDGISFQEAAIKAAQSFTDGGDLFACAMQHLHSVSRVDEEKFKESYPIAGEERNYQRHLSNVIQGYLPLGLRAITGWVYDEPSENQFKSLEDGIYQITTGDKIINKTLTRVNGHATALLVDQKSFLLFDPACGLISLSDPHRYYRIRWTDDDVHMLLRIEGLVKPILSPTPEVEAKQAAEKSLRKIFISSDSCVYRTKVHAMVVVKSTR
jgi:hypothetical protein